MAQSITLVSCNNNNKDTTIYLLVGLSSFFLFASLAVTARDPFLTLAFCLYFSLSLSHFLFLFCNHPVITYPHALNFALRILFLLTGNRKN